MKIEMSIFMTFTRPTAKLLIHNLKGKNQLKEWNEYLVSHNVIC